MTIFSPMVRWRSGATHHQTQHLLSTARAAGPPLIFTDELKDETILPHLLRPNPHGGTFSNMMLYLRMQAEEFAYKKWGSEQGLDEEFDRREYVPRQAAGSASKQGLTADCTFSGRRSRKKSGRSSRRVLPSA